MALWQFLVPLVLAAAVDISLSQKSDKRCSAAGQIKIEPQIPEQQVEQDHCAMASITNVQICEDGEWKAICGEESTPANIKVLCRAKGFSSIGANISTMSQVIGYAMSNFILHCNGSETNPADCLMVENQGSDISHNCQRTIIRCFITDPDPQLCNISLPTTPPPAEYKITTLAIDASTMIPAIASTARFTTTEAPSDLTLVGYTTVAKRSQEDSGNVTLTLPIVGITTVMVVVLIGFAFLIMSCFVVRRRRKAGQKSQIERSKGESHTIVDDSQYAVITECKQEGQRQDAYQYTHNDAYDSKPMHTNSLWPNDDKQQAVEPIYETIPGPVLKSQTTE